MLLRAGVSARKCNEVIVTTIHNRTDYGYQVVENIINNLTPLIVEMSKLPSRQSVDRFRREAGELARIHLAHEFLENYREGITLGIDEAIDAQCSNATFVVHLKSGSFTLAHRKLASHYVEEQVSVL